MVALKSFNSKQKPEHSQFRTSSAGTPLFGDMCKYLILIDIWLDRKSLLLCIKSHRFLSNRSFHIAAERAAAAFLRGVSEQLKVTESGSLESIITVQNQCWLVCLCWSVCVCGGGGFDTCHWNNYFYTMKQHSSSGARSSLGPPELTFCCKVRDLPAAILIFDKVSTDKKSFTRNARYAFLNNKKRWAFICFLLRFLSRMSDKSITTSLLTSSMCLLLCTWYQAFINGDVGEVTDKNKNSFWQWFNLIKLFWTHKQADQCTPR